jgi:hypothetical protein
MRSRISIWRNFLKMANIQKHGHWFRTTDKCCFNCNHLLWMIGVGQGLRCGVDKSVIPGIYHVCDNFSGLGGTEWSCKCNKCGGNKNGVVRKERKN